MTEVQTIVKWAGGKKQLLNQFKIFFPKNINRYFEPFVGGGAVAFHVIQNKKPKEIYLSDINEELINCYTITKNKVEELIKILKEHKKQHDEKYYYQIRSQNPKNLTDLERAGRFIYLNKTCFNGLYRVNTKGEFNAPIGSYTNPAIVQEEELRKISQLLKNITIKIESFEKITSNTKKGDFIYFDPPYYPLKKGKSFTTYTKNNFLEEEQKQLATVFKELDKRGCSVMLSNSDTDFIKDLYKGYNINFVNARRMINCDATKRGTIKEVVITNYPIKAETQMKL